jgi:hypothetical protein
VKAETLAAGAAVALAALALIVGIDDPAAGIGTAFLAVATPLAIALFTTTDKE